MRLIRYRREGKADYGVLTADRVICLPTLAELQNRQLPETLEDFIGLGPEGVKDAEKMVEDSSEKEIKNSSFPVNRVKLLPPVRTPPKIVCLGLNYRDHAAEQDAALPDEPIIFMKPHTTIIGPQENIVKPKFVKKLDYEAELAVVVGRRGKDIPVSEAECYILGYTILNDVSARDIQFKDEQWTRGKSLDTFAPTGPCITTIDQLRDTSNISIRTWVNNQLRQDSTTEEMVLDVNQIIYHLSRVMTLEPCDIIATGTPAGVGFALQPQPKFLKHGDVVRIEIEHIGVLQNRVVNQK